MWKAEEAVTLRRKHDTHDAGRKASPAECETTTGGSLESSEVDEKPQKIKPKTEGDTGKVTN